jgi:Phage integrase family
MEGALAPVERSLRTVKVARKKAGGRAQSVPKHLGDRGLSLTGKHPITQEQSHFPPPCRTPANPPPTCGAYVLHGRLRFREKGGKVVWKPVPDELRSMLEAALAAGAIEHYLVPPEGYLLRKDDRDDRVIWRIVKRVAARAGIEAHVHALRAAFAVYYLERFPGDVEALKELLGHRSIATTQVYLRKLDRASAMERVRELSWGVVGSDDEDHSGSSQTAGKRFASSSAVGAGGFEPP